MENEEIVLLLREMRDLQKSHLESYKEAIKNQQAGLEQQAKAGRLQRTALMVLLVGALVLLAITMLSR